MVKLMTEQTHWKIPEGLHPVKIPSMHRMQVERCLPELTDLNSKLWVYLGNAGKITPWMDDISKTRMLVTKNKAKVERFFWYLESIDVDWRSYCKLVLPLIGYSKWERLLLLLNNKQHWSWIRKLRSYAGSSEMVDSVAEFIMTMMELQVDAYGFARINTSAMLQLDEGVDESKRGSYRVQHYALYHSLVDRFNQFEVQGVDPLVWLNTKFETCKPSLDFVYLATIVNENGFDPDIKTLKFATNDPWRAIKSYLGLHSSCEFPDGSIPKGWLPAKEDFRGVFEIKRVLKDGFYLYENGEQRKGVYHYAKNRYHIIACTPENFEQFKADWRDPRYLTKRPTWEEYSKWAVYPDMWDENGESVNGRIPGVKWRS